MKQYLVLDLEMCMVKGGAIRKMKGMRHEIIQIGAVKLNASHHITDEFVTYVKPEHGKLDYFISKLTGIEERDLETAPTLRGALVKFVDWIGNRDVTILSWSDSDYYQMKDEMRVKKIKYHGIEQLLENWVDFQRSFDRMLGLERQYALKEAMKIGKLRPLGRMHDGLCDAYNTARLFAKIHRQAVFQLELVPIIECVQEDIRLKYSLEELFSPELLAQIELKGEEDTNVISDDKTNWCLWRKMRGLIKGQKAVTNENWNKYLFGKEMWRIDIADAMKQILFCKDS